MSLADVKQAAKGQWHSILTGFGVPAEFLVNRHGPCPMCGGEDRFRYDDKDGDGNYFCNGCGASDGFTLLATYKCWSLGDAVKHVGDLFGVKGEPVKKVDRRQELRALFRGCGDSVFVEGYLDRRGLDGIKAPPCLRYHPNVEGLPAMLAVISGPGGEAVGVHRTHLAESKVRKRTTSLNGSLPKGSAVRLFPLEETLGIAEGIETALAAYQMHGIPTWAVLSTSGMKNFQPPEGVKTLVIFGDRDRNFAGHAAAYTLAHRLSCYDRLDCEVELQFPVEGDWLDELNFVRKANGGTR